MEFTGLVAAFIKIVAQGGADESGAGGDCFDARKEVIGGAVFEHVTFDAEVEGLIEEILVLERGDEYDASGERFLMENPSGIDPGEVGHLDIEYDDIGFEGADGLNCSSPIGHFGDDVDRRIFFKHLNQSAAKHGVIVGDDHTEGVG